MALPGSHVRRQRDHLIFGQLTRTIPRPATSWFHDSDREDGGAGAGDGRPQPGSPGGPVMVNLQITL